ncbi:hypothetical protein [Carboxylicivirga caseinilyticus]|uniref:hypothetical protein n=1 Tax=Carboxylicivirga caseinilyticus TaxID=3417572 RepID=UPI003D358B74|nr:hypothetical protein [Marinilabiliaceae bacterium A049]
MLKNLAIFLLTSMILYSCKEETSYQMQLVIENKTENKISIELFPKNEYLHNDLYKFSDFGGGYSETILELEVDSEKEIFISNNLNSKPSIRAIEVFDSIHISAFDENRFGIKFSHAKVQGYVENLFNEDSFWKLVIRKFDLPTSFRRNPVESSDYIFEISEDKIIPDMPE